MANQENNNFRNKPVGGPNPNGPPLRLQVGEYLKYTVGHDPKLIKRGEKELKNLETIDSFGVVLLKIVDSNDFGDNVKQSSAIYFKNLVKKHWAREERIISNSDRQLIKNNLISVMFNAPKLAQIQLSETISTIANYDFMYENWNHLKDLNADGQVVSEWKLLSVLVDYLNPQKSSVKNASVVLSIIGSITTGYVGKEKTLAMVTQIKYIVKQFVAPIWLRLFEAYGKVAHSNFKRDLESPPSLSKENLEKAKYSIQGLEYLVMIFHDLISIDLIDYLESSVQQWSQLFHSLLFLNDNFNLLDGSDETPGPIDRLRTAIMKAASVFVSNYEDESASFLAPFVDISVKLLGTLDEKGRYDDLVAETTNFMQHVTRQIWNRSLFDQQKLDQVVSHMLVRNIKLRESDLNMYETCGQDWVMRDMEGSDFCTRRRGAIVLLRKMCEAWPNEISEIVNQHVQRLLQSYNNNKEKNFVDFDTAINLFLATNVLGETKADGAVKLLRQNSLQVIQTFMNANIMPYLKGQQQAPHNIVSADCLKYAIMFRSHYPQEMFEQLVPLSCKFLGNEDYVNHTYAAIALERILAMKKKNEGGGAVATHSSEYKYSKQLLATNLPSMLVPLFEVLTTFSDSEDNEYIMKAILRVIARAEEQIGKFIEKILGEMVKIVSSAATKSKKPNFIHYMFEIVAGCISFTCKGNPQVIVEFENRLMTMFVQIIKKDDASDLHPYVFQIIALMLRLRQDVTKQYGEVYDGMLQTDMWMSEGNIIAISSMFADFYGVLSNNMAKFGEFIMANNRLQATLGVFQFLVSKRTHDVYAFRILSALFEYCPLEALDGFMKPLLELVFSRLKAQKTSILCTEFVKCLAVFVIKNDVEKLYQYCENIQPNIFQMILTNVWLSYVRQVQDLMGRLLVTHAMTRMLQSQLFLENQEFSRNGAEIVTRIIDVFEKAPLEDKEEKSLERRLQSLEDQGAGSKFSGLSFAQAPRRSITQTLGDPRQALVRAVEYVISQQSGFEGFLKQQMDQKYKEAFDEYANKFGSQLRLNR